jgi:hypothetical protein
MEVNQFAVLVGVSVLVMLWRDVGMSLDDVAMSYYVDYVVIDLVYFEVPREVHQLGIGLA